MLQLLGNMMILLEQTAREKKLTYLYIGLFLLFVLMLILDARTKKQYTGPKAVTYILLFFIFLATIGLIIAYIRL